MYDTCVKYIYIHIYIYMYIYIYTHVPYIYIYCIHTCVTHIIYIYHSYIKYVYMNVIHIVHMYDIHICSRRELNSNLSSNLVDGPEHSTTSRPPWKDKHRGLILARENLIFYFFNCLHELYNIMGYTTNPLVITRVWLESSL